MSKQQKQVACDPEVKAIVSRLSHKKCTCPKRRKYCSSVTGKKLNSWLCDCRDMKEDLFRPRKHYKVCNNLFLLISKPRPSTTQLNTSNTTNTTSQPTASTHETTSEPGPPLSREERLFKRTRIPVKDMNGINRVNVVVGGELEEVIDLTGVKNTRMSTKEKFRDDLLGSTKRSHFKVPFGRLTMRQRRLRMQEFGKIILSACIDRHQFKTNDNVYLEHNEDVAVDVLNLISGMKEYMEKKMKMNFDKLEEKAMVPIEDDTDGLIATLDEKTHKLALSLLGETSSQGYHRMKLSLKPFTPSLPSYYKLTKNRPSIVQFDINPVLCFEESNEDSTSLVPTSIIPSQPDASLLVEASTSNTDIEEEIELESVLRACSKSDTLNSAKIDDVYAKYIQMLEDKHSKHQRYIKDTENVLVIDSIDGAEHLRSKKNITSVISFSTTLMTPDWINSRKVTAGSSLNVLTWQQVQGTESLSVMLPAVTAYFEQKKMLKETVDSNNNRNNYYYYDLHDGKMLYLLTMHSQWNRIHKPFLICGCKRGAGVMNPDHECKLFTHEEQIEKYERSARRWDAKRRQIERRQGTNTSETYGRKEHMNWID